MGAEGRSKLRGGSALVIVQVALSLVLLMGAGLFLRSLQRAETAEFGLDPEGVVSLTVDLSMLGRSEQEGRVFFEEIERRYRDLPGVESVSRATFAPLDWSARGVLTDVGRDLGNDLGTEMATLGSFVSADYFETVSTPILQGRTFDRDDDDSSPAVVIVNQTYADQVWPGESALGQQVRLRELGGEMATVVGVAANGKYRQLGESPRPYVYLPLQQHYQAATTLLIRSRQPVGQLVEQAVTELRGLEPNLAVQNVGPLASTITSRALGPIRMIAALAGSFGLVGLALAAMGLYGVIAFGVTQRNREIGLRLALGARANQVLRQVLERGLVLATIGVVIGGACSLALTRVLGSFLVGVSASDPLTYSAVITGMIAVATLSCLAPAMRAAHIDPVRTLKAE